MAANKRMMLEQHHNPDFVPGIGSEVAMYRYRVAELGNSVEYNIGQFLSKNEVHGICENAAWTVTIRNPK